VTMSSGQPLKACIVYGGLTGPITSAGHLEDTDDAKRSRNMELCRGSVYR
jgi:hypothetical protein